MNKTVCPETGLTIFRVSEDTEYRIGPNAICARQHSGDWFEVNNDLVNLLMGMLSSIKD